MIGRGTAGERTMREHFPDHYDGPSEALVKWLEHVPRAVKVLRWYPQRWLRVGSEFYGLYQIIRAARGAEERSFAVRGLHRTALDRGAKVSW